MCIIMTVHYIWPTCGQKKGLDPPERFRHLCPTDHVCRKPSWELCKFPECSEPLINFSISILLFFRSIIGTVFWKISVSTFENEEFLCQIICCLLPSKEFIIHDRKKNICLAWILLLFNGKSNQPINIISPTEFYSLWISSSFTCVQSPQIESLAPSLLCSFPLHL